MIGDMAAGMITLETSPCHLTAEPPAAASVEPITPPMRACEELDGMPKSQVSRFQMMPRLSLTAAQWRTGQGVSGPRYGIRTTVMLSAPPASTANFTMSAAAPSGSVSAFGSASRARSAPSAR